jgi:hypothetical protein
LFQLGDKKSLWVNIAFRACWQVSTLKVTLLQTGSAATALSLSTWLPSRKH